MRDDDGDLSFLFELVKGLVEPGKNSTWVISLGPEVKVKDIAGLGVHSHNVHFIIYLSVSSPKFLCEIAYFCEILL